MKTPKGVPFKQLCYGAAFPFGELTQKKNSPKKRSVLQKFLGGKQLRINQTILKVPTTLFSFIIWGVRGLPSSWRGLRQEDGGSGRGLGFQWVVFFVCCGVGEGSQVVELWAAWVWEEGEEGGFTLLGRGVFMGGALSLNRTRVTRKISGDMVQVNSRGNSVPQSYRVFGKMGRRLLVDKFGETGIPESPCRGCVQKCWAPRRPQ